MDRLIKCVICKKKKSLDGKCDVTHKEKGSEGINPVSKERNDTSQQSVDSKCITIAEESIAIPATSSGLKKLFCLRPQVAVALLNEKENTFSHLRVTVSFLATRLSSRNKKRLDETFRVTTIETKDTILRICSERKDEWSETVRARLLNVHDLPAADAVYHQTCSVNVRTRKQLPKVHETDEQPPVERSKVGRPPDEEERDAFVKVAKFLEENDD